MSIDPPDLKIDYSIDYDHWLKRDVWKIGAAAGILENTDPGLVRLRLDVDSEFHQRFWKTLNLIISAEGRTLEVEEKSIWIKNEKSLEYGLVKPGKVIQWAHSLGYKIPKPLSSLLNLENYKSDARIGIPAQRKKKLHEIITDMIKERIFSAQDSRWPRTKIWTRAVKEHPDLFPDDKNDQREGKFSRAYTPLLRELKR